MYSFAQLTGISFKINCYSYSFDLILLDYPTMKFSPLLISVIVILGLIIDLITGFSIDYIVGISFGVASIIISLAFIFLIRYLVRHKDYIWTANVTQFIKKTFRNFTISTPSSFYESICTSSFKRK